MRLSTALSGFGEAGARCDEATTNTGRHRPEHARLRRPYTAYDCRCGGGGGLKGAPVVELLLPQKDVNPDCRCHHDRTLLLRSLRGARGRGRHGGLTT